MTRGSAKAEAEPLPGADGPHGESALDLTETTIHKFPHAFVNKSGEPTLIWPLRPKQHTQLIERYLAYRPRNSFSGLPPLDDEVCRRWAAGVVENGISIVALSFEEGLAGHAALFPMDEALCDMLVVVWPAYRMLGIGTELTHCLVQLAHEMGFSGIKLNVEARNHVARHVYEKCGFRCTGGDMLDELDMSIDLGRYRQRINIPVREVMDRHLISVRADMPCRVALVIFLADRIYSLPVTDEKNELVGIISQSDLLAEANIRKKVGEVQTRDVVWVRDGCTVAKVISLFRSRKLRQIPVLDDQGKLVGIVSRREILAHFLKRFGRFED